MKTDITIILDRSGSMQSVRTDTIGGFNSFLAEQKKVEGEANLSLVQFDDQYEVVFEPKDIKSVSDLTEATFQPRGSTALYDAIGRTINATGKRLADTPEGERPDIVLMVILTDGAENASQEFSALQVGELIRHQTDVYKWEFVFIGANQDAILSAKAIGIQASNALSYAANAVGTAAVYSSVSNNLTSRRMGRSMGMSFSERDRQKQRDAGAK